MVLGIADSDSDRHGGPVHRYWARRIAEHLRASGYTVTEEVPIGGGKAIDLVAERDGKRIAYEIETGKSDAAANVRKCLAAGMDKVVVVATSTTVHRALSRRIRPGLNVTIVTAAALLRSPAVGDAGDGHPDTRNVA